MASWRLCAAAERLRDELEALFPNRDKASDGSIGDSAHSQRSSDHNPDENGWVRAIDVDEDVWGSRHADPAFANRLVRQLVTVAKGDKRLKYIIFEGHIWSATYRWEKRVHTGAPHDHHIHISFTPAGDEDASPFGLVQDLKTEVAKARPVTKKAVGK